MLKVMMLMSPLSDFSSQWAAAASAAGGSGMQRTAQQCNHTAQCNALCCNAFAQYCTKLQCICATVQCKLLLLCAMHNAPECNAQLLDCDWPPHYIPITGRITSRQASTRQSLLSYGHRHEDEYLMIE